jgi:hypothetical protein|nr:MAG TPA: lectin [Caudoviricetes sp.]
MKVRYIRESMNGSNANSGCHWCEIQAIDYEGVNVALNKTVTCEGGTYEKGTLAMVTNGNTTVDDYIYFRNDAQNTISVTVDLENVEELDNIKVWHYHGGGRTYHNILLETSLDGIKWVEVFNSNKNGEYVEVETGKTHKLKDDRLPLLNENSSLNEVTSFYEKYIEQDISNKEFLKNVLTSKEIECNDDKMLSLINKVGSIATGKKWASGVGVESNSTHSFTYLDNTTLSRTYVDLVIDFTPSIIVMSYRKNANECLTVLNNIGTIGTVNNVKCAIYNSSYFTNSSFNFKNDANVTLRDNVYRLPLTVSFCTNITWVAYE